MTVRSVSSNGGEQSRSQNGSVSELHLHHPTEQHEPQDEHLQPPLPAYIDADELSNADLYRTMTPPAYAVSAAEHEISLDAERVQDEKQAMSPGTSTPSTLRGDSGYTTTHPAYEQAQPIPRRPVPVATATGSQSDLTPLYISPSESDAILAHVRRCSVLPERPAVWLVKKNDLSLSPLAASTLVKEGLLRYKDLEPISQSAGLKRDPSDPLSGIIFATYDTVGDMMLGLAGGPIAAHKHYAPMLVRQEQERGKEEEGVDMQHSKPQEQFPVLTQQLTGTTTGHGAENNTPIPFPESTSPDRQPDLGHSDPAQPKPTSWEPKPSSVNEPKAASQPNAAKAIAIGTGKGFGRIIGATLKSPMTLTHAATRGFHNVPKLYGEEVREVQNVTGIGSGLSVSMKGFGHGLGDGLRDFFVKPIEGAQQEGGKGFIKGVGRGIGNVVCKPAAGTLGLVGYSFVGVYKEIEKIGKGQTSAGEVFQWQGEKELAQSTDQERLEIVKRWCHALSRPRP